MTSNQAVPPAPGRQSRRRFFRTHKVLSALLVLLLVGAAVGIAAVVWTQDLTASPATRTSPVVFAAGDDAASLDALDFLGASDPVISASGAAASFTPYGIPGASSLSLGEVVELQNPDTADDKDYIVTLSADTSGLDSDVTAFVLEFDDDVDGAISWNLLTTPTLAAHTLDDGEVWEFSLTSLKMAALASGAQGDLVISASITPAP